MNSSIKTLLLSFVVLAVGLLAGHGTQLALSTYQGRAEAVQAGDYSALIAQGDAPVVLFTTATCPYCTKAKTYLEGRGIAYRNVDVTTPAGRALFKQYDGSGVPLLMTATLRLQGFMQPEYDRHLRPLARG